MKHLTSEKSAHLTDKFTVKRKRKLLAVRNPRSDNALIARHGINRRHFPAVFPVRQDESPRGESDCRHCRRDQRDKYILFAFFGGSIASATNFSSISPSSKYSFCDFFIILQKPALFPYFLFTVSAGIWFTEFYSNSTIDLKISLFFAYFSFSLSRSPSSDAVDGRRKQSSVSSGRILKIL